MAFQSDAFQNNAFQIVRAVNLGLISQPAVAFDPLVSYAQPITLGLIDQTATATSPTSVLVSTKARVASESVDVLMQPTDALVRVASESVDVVIVPTDALARTASVSVDVLIRLTELVHTDLALSYQVIAPAIKNLVIDYSISNVTSTEAGASLEIEYIIGAPGGAHADLGFRYRVTKPSKFLQRGADLKLKMKVLAPTVAGKNLNLNWVTEPALSVAGADLQVDLSNLVNVTAGPDLDFSYAVEIPRPRGDLTFAAQVSQPTPSSELTINPAIHTLAGGELEVDWTVIGVARSDLTINPAVATLASSDLSIDYEIAITATSDLTIDAPIANAAGSSLGIDYAIDSTAHAFSDLTFSYQVQRTGRIDDSDLYFVPGEVIMPRQRRPHPVGAGYAFGWAIANALASDLKLEQVIAYVSWAGFDMSWRIHEARGVDLPFEYGVDDFWEQNRQVLLSEIDPDLLDLPGVR